MTDTREQIRAAVLALVMVISVFGGTVAFAGGAAATASDFSVQEDSVQSDGTVTVSTTINETTAGNATFQFDNGSATETRTIEDDGSTDLEDNTTGNITAEIGLPTLELGFADGDTVTVSVDEGDTYAEPDGSDTVQIDDTAPTATIDAPRDGALTNASTIEYTASDGDSVAAATLTIARNNGTEYYNGSAWVASETTIDVADAGGTYDIAEFGVDTYTVTLNVADAAGNTANDTITFERDAATPDDVTLDLRDTEDVTVKSEDNLNVVYEYIEDNTQTVTVTLEGKTYQASGDSYTYVIDDEGYISTASKSVTLDLDEQAGTSLHELDDGAYSVTIEAEDAVGQTNSTTTDGAPVVVDDRRPDVTVENLAPTADVAPDDTVDVTYDYADATNATELTLILVDASDRTIEDAITEQVDHKSGTDHTQTFDLSSADIDDNTEYDIYLIAEDSVVWTGASDYPAGTLDVNADAPQIDSVEANAGEETVTVSFSEPIGDRLDRTDFAYQDVSDDGATGIDNVVHEDGTATAILTLDNPVSAADLGTDLLNARSNEMPDTAAHDPRYVDSGETVALQDTTAPTVTPADITAATINQDNEAAYGVTVDLEKELVDVAATVSDSETEASDSVSEQRHTATVDGLNVTSLSDGHSTTVTVTVTDAGGNVDTATVAVEKDTVSPSIESVQANAGTQSVEVTFDEEMSYLGTDAFDLTGVDATVRRVEPDASADDTVYVVLDSDVSLDEINTSDATITATAAATDAAGNPAEGTPVQLNDTETPHLVGLDAAANDATVTVAFSEGVVNASGQALDADDFVYDDVSDDGAGAIEGVAHEAGSTEATVTLDAAVTATDLDTDELGVAADAVYDANESGAPASTLALDDSMAPDVELETTADGETITYTVTANEELDAIEVSVDTRHDLVTERAFMGSPVAETLTTEDFEQQSTEDGYVYTANYTAPRDGQYDADLITATDLAGNDGAAWAHAVAAVDTAAPSAVDAIVDSHGNDRVAVVFDEPIDASAVDRGDITVDGASVDRVDHWHSDGDSGLIIVDLYEPLQTGDEPTVTVNGDSFRESTNDWSAGQTTPVTVHTMKLELSEGTNFVSVPAISGGQDLGAVDTSNVDVIWSYTGDEWEKYDPDDPESDFTALEGGQGYIVEMENADVLDVNVYNLPASSTGEVDGALMNQQQLDEGWNLIGHYQTESQPAVHALSSIDEDVHVVYGQSAGYEYDLVELDEPLSAGESYWVFVKDDTVYTHAPSDSIRLAS